MPQTTPKGRVPAPIEGSATPVEATFQEDLVLRTLWRIAPHIEAGEISEAETVLREAFREANCDLTLFDVTFLDLDNHKRVLGRTAQGESVSIVCDHLPEPGTILNFSNHTYYIASRKEGQPNAQA